MQQQHDSVLDSVLTPPPENNEQKFNQNTFWMTANGEKSSAFADPCEFIPFLFEPETDKPNEQIMLKNDENKIKNGCSGVEENEVEIIETKLPFEDLTICKEIQNHRELLDVDIKNKPDFDEKIDEEIFALRAENSCDLKSENDDMQNRKGNTKEKIRIDIKSKPIQKHSAVSLKHMKKIEKSVLKPVKFDVPVILYQVKDPIKNVNFISQSAKVNGFSKSGLCSVM